VRDRSAASACAASGGARWYRRCCIEKLRSDPPKSPCDTVPPENAKMPAVLLDDGRLLWMPGN